MGCCPCAGQPIYVGFSSDSGRRARLEEPSLAGVARYIRGGHARRIVVLSGAGISVSAGIPDFRSPEVGLYSNLEKFNLRKGVKPEKIFDLDYFKLNPAPFYALCKELYPGKYKPTLGHFFIKMLYDRGLLLRNFTQNIDGLERQCGIPPDVVVQAHGNLDKHVCVRCGKQQPQGKAQQSIMKGNPLRCGSCGGLVKPTIVFFGEELPKRFYSSLCDLEACDLLICCGTSLKVEPFNTLIGRVRGSTPRVLINREAVGLRSEGHKKGFLFGQPQNYRDVLVQGDCDAGFYRLAALLGWDAKLQLLRRKGEEEES